MAALLAARGAGAQQLQVAVEKAPHYVGTFIEIQVTATGFTGQPAPELEVPAPSHGRLDFVDLQRSSSQSISIVNGRMTRREDVQGVYRYRFIADAPGDVAIGPFELSQGGAQAKSRPLRLRLREPEQSERLRVELKLPEGPIFVGQRVPISVEFWLESELQKNLHDYTLHVPLFDRTDAFRFIDAPADAGSTDVKVETARGTLRLSGSAREEVQDGTSYFVVTIPRTMIPSRAGRFELLPVSFVVDEATRWQRDFFGGRRVTHVRKLGAVDPARRIEVAAVPSQNRPESYAGAVGRGYSLEVSVDRSVVQMGDPITLTLTLRGEGNLQSAGLPPLAADGLLDPAQFRVPVGELAGRVEGDTKRFTAVVRVESPDVREIPSLDYTWFDADTRTFQTTRSRPIALSVRPARLVRAADVVSGDASEEPGELAAEPGEAPPPTREPEPAMAVTAADLAIERDVGTLAKSVSSSVTDRMLLAGSYLAPCLLLAVALVDRRRRAVDPALVRLRRHLDAQRRRVVAAAALSGREQARELAGALREMLALVPEAQSAELDALLGECDALVYAPGELRPPAGEPLAERALAYALHILERVR